MAVLVLGDAPPLLSGAALHAADWQRSRCATLVRQAHRVIVEEAPTDQRLQHDPLVQEAPGVQFLASIPLAEPDSEPFGWLCVMDTTPRTLNDDDWEALAELADLVISKWTCQREAEVLQARERHWRRMVDEHPEALALTTDGAISYANQAAADLYGVASPEALRGRSIFEIAPAKHHPMLKERLAALDRGEETDPVELDFVGADGTERVVEIFSVPFHVNGGTEVETVVRNVTERKRAEDKVRFQAQLLNAVGQAVIATDLDGTVLYVNHAAEALFGWSAEEAIGRNVSEITTAEGFQKHAEEIMARLQAGECWSGEFQLQRQDGTTFPAFVSDTPVRDAEGSLIGIVGVTTDLTRLKQAEQALRESEELHRTTLANITDAVFITDDAGAFTYVCPNVQYIFGYTRKELLARGTIAAALGHDPAQPEVLAADGEQINLQHAVVDKDGQRHDLLVSVRRVDIQGGTRLYTCRDVTELTRAEAAREEAEHRYQQIVEHASDGFLLAEVHGGLLALNQRVCEMTGYTRDELLGMTPEDLLTPESLAAHPPEWGRLGDKEPVCLEREFLRKDGTTFPAEVSIVRIDAETSVAVVRDVTERRQAEASLRESERRLATLMENLPGLVYRLHNDADWTVDFISEGCVALTGYPQDAFYGDGKGVFANLTHPDDRQYVRQTVDTALAKEHPFQVTYRIITAEGDERWVWEQGRGIRGEDGSVAYLEGFITDITERRAAEQALEESEERFQTLLRSLNDVVWAAEADGYPLLYINDAVEQVYGVSPEEWYAQPEVWKTMIRPDDQTQVLEDRERLYRDGEIESTYRIIRPDGEERWVHDRKHVVYDEAGRPLRLGGIITDITRYKRAEEKLLRIRKAVESASDAIGIADEKGEAVFHNQAFIDLFGFTPDALKAAGGPPAMFADPDTGHEVLDLLLQGGSWSGDVDMLDREGRVVPVALRADAIKNAQDTVIGLVAVFTDVTERKEYEQQLIQAKEQAEAMHRLKSAFLTNMSHEIRTPLTGIIGFTELIIGEQGEEHQEIVQLIHKSSRRLLNTLNSVMDLAQLESDSMDLQPERIDVCPLIEETLALFKPQVQEGRLQVQAVLPDDAVPVVVDRAALERVLNNLVANAIKFTHEGRVTVELERHGAAVEIRVIDTGVGIDAAFLPHLFDEFKQESTGLARGYEGNGLGLAITKRLLHLMGGTIDVQSVKGEGSTFTVRLPVRPEDSTELSPSS